MEQHLKIMQQTLTYLAINSQDPSTDPGIRCVSSTIATHKRQLESIVSSKNHCLEKVKQNSNSRKKNYQPSHPKRKPGQGKRAPLCKAWTRHCLLLMSKGKPITGVAL